VLGLKYLNKIIGIIRNKAQTIVETPTIVFEIFSTIVDMYSSALANENERSRKKKNRGKDLQISIIYSHFIKI